MVALTIDSKQLRKLERALGDIKGGVPKALRGAINKTLNTGRTVIRREIRKEYLIKQKDIPIKVHGASSGSAQIGGFIRLDDGMMPLNKFKVQPRGVQRRKNKRPLFAQVKKGAGGTMPGAFFIPATGPFVRVHGAARFPIKFLRTISAPIMATQPSVGPAANQAMGVALDKNIDNQIVRIMAQAGGH